MVQGRDAHPVDVHAGVFRSSAPDHHVTAACGSARDAGHVFHDLQHIALRAGDATRALCLDARRHHLLRQLRRHHDNLHVIGRAGLDVDAGDGLDVVTHAELLARVEPLLRLQRGQLRPRQRDGVRPGLESTQLEAALGVRHGLLAAVEVNAHPRHGLTGAAAAHLTTQHRLGGRRLLQHELVFVLDLDGGRLAVDFGRLELELLHGLERGRVKRRARGADHARSVDLARRRDQELEHHRHPRTARSLALW